jgi:hypothetical protein
VESRDTTWAGFLKEAKADECVDTSRNMLIYRTEKFNLRKDD